MASNYALLIVDMFNRLDFPGAEDLTPGAVAIAGPIANLSKEIVTGGGTVIYCNDNLTTGIDPADYQHAMLLHGGPSATVAGPLYTGDGTLLVVKPGHSGFFRTDLEEVLRRRSISNLTVVGVAADLCVLATAIDAAMRDFVVCVIPTLIAAESQSKLVSALTILRESFRIEVREQA